MNNLIIIGAADHTRHCIDVIELQGKYKIVGITDSNLPPGNHFEGYPTFGKEECIQDLKKELGITHVLVCIGDNYIRMRVFKKVKSWNLDLKFASAIHPSVIIGKNVTIGEGTVIVAGVIINNDTIIGENCFLGTKSCLGHASNLGNFSSLAPGVTCGGNVSIGECTTIGLGANILHYKTIGSNTIIGAGSLVTKDFGDNVIAYGSPAKIIRTRQNGEKYL